MLPKPRLIRSCVQRPNPLCSADLVRPDCHFKKNLSTESESKAKQ